MLNFLVWLIAGTIIGGLTSLVMWTREDLRLNIMVGAVGAIFIGIVLTPLTALGQTNLSIPALLVSLEGAIILLAVVTLLRRGGLSTR